MWWHNFVAWSLDAWVSIKPDLPLIVFFVALIGVSVYMEWKHRNDGPDDFDGFGW